MMGPMQAQVEVDKILRILVTHMQTQKEWLVYTEFNWVDLDDTLSADDLFFPLLKVSRMWKIERLVASLCFGSLSHGCCG